VTFLDSAPELSQDAAPSAGGRWFILDVFKAIGCLVIVWHHLSVYSPMFDRAMLLAPSQLALLHDYGQLAVQAFLVVGGFLTASHLLRVLPANAQGLPAHFSLLRLLRKKFLRLAIPLMAALALTVWVTALVRPWYPHSSLSGLPTLWGMAVHLLMLQDIAVVEALSAGIWYVAIDFQLYALALLTLWVAAKMQAWQARIKLRGAMVLLWLFLTALSLAWWNRQSNMNVQGLYFFGSYGLGMLAYRVRLSGVRVKGWAIIFILGLMALWLEPRLRIGLAWGMALILAICPEPDKAVTERSWILSLRRALSTIALRSYSLFLTHFAISLMVSAVWFHAGWQDPWINLLGLLLAFALSLMAGYGMYRWVESRPATWQHLLVWQMVFVFSGLAVMALT
jgi:peptidoglycan/LPS O-acetylase OafA/YrhL